ncbi:MAG: anion permease [Phycisphaerales bacterium]|nr:anion permease [Phycisphaerales bacterium]
MPSPSARAAQLTQSAEAGESRGPGGGFSPRARLVLWTIVLTLPVVAFVLMHLGGQLPLHSVLLAIALLAAGLWTTELIDPAATGVLVIALLATCIGLPAGLGAPWASVVAPGGKPISGVGTVLASLSSDVMLLMWGSLVLGRASLVTALSERIALVILKPFASSPTMLAAGLLISSALLSMWMTNTASAAIVLAVAAPIVTRRDPLARAAVLAIASGCNLGAVASPVGTPPTAMATQQLRELGTGVTFTQWLLFGLPFACALLIGAFITIKLLIPMPRRWDESITNPLINEHTHSTHHAGSHTNKHAITLTAIVFIACVLLWILGSSHGIPPGVVALSAASVLIVTGIVSISDLRSLQWDVLLLIFAGLCLGEMLDRTGLARLAVQASSLHTLSPAIMVGSLALIAMVLSAFMSNTAVAALLLPAALSIILAAAPRPTDTGLFSSETSAALFRSAFAVAMGAASAMPLAVSTPANALCFSSGAARSRDFLILGTVVGLIGIGLCVALELIP